MRIGWFDSLYVQAGTIAVACVSVIVLALLLIGDIAGSTREALTEESRQQCLAAASELKRQYEERVAYGEPLPRAAGRELSLRGLAETVLRSYDGVTGGFYESGSAVGVARRESLTEIEGDLRTLTAAVSASNRPQASARIVGRDAVVSAVVPVDPGFAAWTTKRLVAVRDPVLNKRRFWMAALVAAAFTGVLGVATITLHLRQGVSGIKTTLRRLGDELTYRPPPQRGDFGEIAAALAQMADRRSQLEGGIRKQERLAALGKLIAGVAHEIRNPLNSMKLALELLERRVDSGTARPTEVRAAIEQVDRLDLILGRLLAFGRAEPHERRLQNLAPLVRRAVALVEEQSRAKQLRLNVDAPGMDEALQADVDGPQIEQVLVNLLLNAIEASPFKGEVSLQMAQRNGCIEIGVRDAGHGVSAEAKEHLFDAFYTTKPEGTGLGLPVSREIAENHGGELAFTNLTTGAMFTVRLPVHRNLA